MVEISVVCFTQTLPSLTSMPDAWNNGTGVKQVWVRDIKSHEESFCFIIIVIHWKCCHSSVTAGRAHRTSTGPKLFWTWMTTQAHKQLMLWFEFFCKGEWGWGIPTTCPIAKNPKAERQSGFNDIKLQPVYSGKMYMYSSFYYEWHISCSSSNGYREERHEPVLDIGSHWITKGLVPFISSRI